MTAKRIELRPKRDLIDNNFDGYKLSLESLPVYSCELTDVDVVELSDEFYSFQHVKSCSFHNHLHKDPWQPNHVYYVASDWSVKHFKATPKDSRLSDPVNVFTIPRNGHLERKGQFNVTIHFSSENFVSLADGLGTVYVLETGDRSESRSWKVRFSTDRTSEDVKRPFLLLHSTMWSPSTVDCLLLHVEEKSAVDNIGGDEKNPFATVLVWISVTLGEGVWKLNRTRRIVGWSSIDYAALEPNGKGVCIVSEKPFRFTYDSAKPLIAVENVASDLGKPKEPAYAWTQNADDISVLFKFAENVSKEDVTFQLTSSHLFLGLRDGSILLQGLLFSAIDMEGSTWTLLDNQLEVTLTKTNRGLVWQELVKGDVRGEEIIDESLASEIHERLAHLTSDKLNPDPQGNRMGAFNPQQLEECDTFPIDSYFLVRIDGETHRVTHEVSLSSHQWLFSASKEADTLPAICVRHDVDGLLWQPSFKATLDSVSEEWNLEHVATFNALGYVLASKQQKKFLCCSLNDSFVALCDVRRHLYLYFQPTNELRNRKAGNRLHLTAKQKIISLDNSDVLGLHVSNENVFVLSKEALYFVKVISE